MRKVVWFSCGSASAVAAKLAVKQGDCEVVYCDTGGEHESNKKFLKDVEKWIGQKITVLKNEKYEDHYDVFRKVRYINGIKGPACTKRLKKDVRVAYQDPDDVHIFGYTVEEKNRAEKFDMRNPELTEWLLINEGITKADTLGILWKAGIEIPLMYSLGYGHNNCIGCPQGKKGYWNKIRVDWPERFHEMAQIERELKYAICRVYLDELDPTAGNITEEEPISCGISCYDAYDLVT